MKVLHIGKFFPPHRGGMETFLRDLMVEQQRQGFEVRAIVHRSERSFWSINQSYLSGHQRLKITRVPRWGTAVFTPISPSFTLQLNRILRDFKPDVLHIHMPNVSAFWCLLSLAARRIPWVIHWHSDVVASDHSLGLRILGPLYRIPERKLLLKADRIIATSPPYLASSRPLQEVISRCMVIPLGLPELPVGETHPQTPTPEEHHRSSEAGLKILAVGRLTYYKGFRYLLKAVALIPESSLTIVGSGEEQSSLEQMIGTLGISCRVTLKGNCCDDELLALYKYSDLLCLTSIERTEAFGMVLLEAMRAGLPCIATSVDGSGMPWVLGQEHPSNPNCDFIETDVGAIAKASSVSAIVAAIRVFLENRDKLKSAGCAAVSRHKACFDIGEVTKEIGHAYQTNLTGKR